MWALVDDADNVTEIIAHPKSLIIDDIRHPKKIFSAWTDAEKRAIGLYEVTPASKFDESYYINSNASYAKVSTKVVETITKVADKALADINEVDENGDPLLDDDGVQVVTLGLKSNAKNKATTQANGYLQGFDWFIQRKVTANTAIPSAVTTYMAAIRTDHGNICTAIDGASDMTAFIALHNDTYKEDGTVDVVARVNRWTSDANVKAYRR